MLTLNSGAGVSLYKTLQEQFEVEYPHAQRRNMDAGNQSVALSLFEKNMLACVRFVRRPIRESDFESLMQLRTGKPVRADALRPILRSLKGYGHVLDLKMQSGALLWMPISGDERQDRETFAHINRTLGD